MRTRAWLVAVASLALAQTAGAQSGPPTTAGPLTTPGVDVWTTLNPRSPQSTVTQTNPPSAVSGQPLTTTPGAGINTGNVIIVPSVTLGAFYDDNVFARNTNRQGDWAAVLRPEIAVRSNNWENTDIAAGAFLEKRWYRRFESEDQINGGVGIGGTHQPDANTQLVGRLQYTFAHEDRGSSENIFNTFDRPIGYHQFEAAGAVNKRFGRMWTSLGAAAAWINFEDPTIAGFTISQDYRNGDIIRVPARIGYVVAPLTSVFLEVSGNRRNFHVDAFDSRGYRIVGGMLFEPGPGSRIRGEAYAGYMRQDYSQASFQDVSTWTIGSSLGFLIAPNVIATLESRRDAKEAALTGGIIPGDGVSVIETAIAGRADVTIARNFVVGAGAAYVVSDFLQANRVDRVWSPLASVKYFVNPHLTLGFDYRYLNFGSSGPGIVGHYRNVYLFSANFRL